MKKVFLFGSLIILFAAAFIIITEGCNVNKETAVAAAEFQFKDKLSDYGFFKGPIKELNPAAGIFHYQLATALFSDYAVKDRFIALPAGKSIQYKTKGPLDFPDSSIIIKNFAYTNEAHQKIMIETRLLVKDPFDKKWKVMDYLWNSEQTDAVKHITGAKIPIRLLNDEGVAMSTTYQVPTTNDCKRCHINNSELMPIGPKARNLNFVIEGQPDNQLKQWAHSAYLKGLPDTATEQLPNWKDSKNFTLDQRARAYLDVNCAHCHTKGGDAFNTGLFLEYEQTERSPIGIMKSPVSAGGGAGGLNYDIVPGDASHSVVAYRMNSAEPGTAMPELARTLVHKDAVKLITEWINKMPGK